MKSNPKDELAAVLMYCGFDIPGYRFAGRKEFEPHHIFGNFGQRYDLVSNIVSVSSATHDWCHSHKHQSDWRIASLWLKMKKGELCPEEFRTVTGKCLAGWLEMQNSENSQVELMRQELLAKYGETK